MLHDEITSCCPSCGAVHDSGDWTYFSETTLENIYTCPICWLEYTIGELVQGIPYPYE